MIDFLFNFAAHTSAGTTIMAVCMHSICGTRTGSVWFSVRRNVRHRRRNLWIFYTAFHILRCVASRCKKKSLYFISCMYFVYFMFSYAWKFNQKLRSLCMLCVVSTALTRSTRLFWCNVTSGWSSILYVHGLGGKVTCVSGKVILVAKKLASGGRML